MNPREEQIYEQAFREREEAKSIINEFDESDIWELFRENHYYPIDEFIIIGKGRLLNISGDCRTDTGEFFFDEDTHENGQDIIEQGFDVDMVILDENGDTIYYEPFNA